MRVEYTAELHLALAEGLLSREDADALGEEAACLGRSPLELLVERGKLTAETLASLRREGGSADPDEAVTRDPAAPDRARAIPAFPVAGWERYEPIRFLGRGGMGMVFLARDLRLHRDVAVKFVRGDDAGSIPRLISEARAQARVSHERVCKVYEVGEAAGQVYIAMQYINGEPLSALAGRLTVEQKAALIRDAARGVHEAHRQGIVHRDLKPANILVERTEDGELRPYVADFGLARSLQEGATETGTILGTPHFMSPEQARGEVSRLDRRADVYSLGATLYAVLTGAPPIPGENALEVLSRVATEEPRPPRELDPDIPMDLEAIALKCLEKDRAARYDSARALAEDLDRFLNGDAVLARAAGAWSRLRRKVHKHRRAVAAAAVAAAMVLAALSFGLRARGEAAERERLARRFTEMVERIESMARYSALSPLHDIRGDQGAIRARMEELDAEIARAGPVAAGPGHYALGRGYLALDDDARAREHLETAWQHGFHEPRAAYALALVLGHLYRAHVHDADRIEQREQREAKVHEIARQYRDPALAYLKQSAGADVPSAAYVAALVAFYEDRFDDALKQLDTIGSGLPWFYEAPALRGDVLVARAWERSERGDREGAMADFDAGRQAYAAAAAVGESAPTVLAAMGELEHAALRTELYGQGDVRPCFERGEEAMRRALTVLPDRDASLLLEARLLRRYAEHLANQGSDVDDLLARATAAAERASPPEGRLELGRIHYQWARTRQARNQDPRAELQKALAIFAGIRPEERDYDDRVFLGLISQTWADYEDQIGLDALAHRAASIEAYSAAVRLDERRADAFINLGATYFARASRPRCPDPDGDLEQARLAIDRAQAINPKQVVPYFYQGQIHALRAERVRGKGGDPRPELELALARYRAGLAENPGVPHLHNGAGGVLLGLAQEAWDRGQDPDPLLDQARAAYGGAIAAAPDQGFGYHNVSEALIQRALVRLARGEDPGPTVREAIPFVQKAIDRIPDHVLGWANLGALHAIRAAFEQAEGRDPRPVLDESTAALEQALRRNPNDPQSHRYLGEGRGTRARFLAEQRQAAEDDFERAADELEKAIELAPDDHQARIALGRVCDAWASWRAATGRDPGPSARRGLALAEKALVARPTWPEARALRAGLQLVLAQAAGRPEEQRAEAARAAAGLRDALRDNPNLEHAWRSRATLAERLSTAPR